MILSFIGTMRCCHYLIVRTLSKEQEIIYLRKRYDSITKLFRMKVFEICSVKLTNPFQDYKIHIGNILKRRIEQIKTERYAQESQIQRMNILTRRKYTK